MYIYIYIIYIYIYVYIYIYIIHTQPARRRVGRQGARRVIQPAPAVGDEQLHLPGMLRVPGRNAAVVRPHGTDAVEPWVALLV